MEEREREREEKILRNSLNIPPTIKTLMNKYFVVSKATSAAPPAVA